MGKAATKDGAVRGDWSAEEFRRLRSRLFRWFRRHARDLPWRKTRDLYAVWISEIMLQQTQVVTVIPYFERFLERFPDVASLAAAEEQEVLRYWEGLGYYRRARQLHAAARQIMGDHGGQFPQSLQQWLALPGIGRYTAGAILSIACDERLPILEANTIRLFSRLLRLETDPRTGAAQRRLWEFAERILPARDCGRFNQALMELGSEICRPRDPGCEQCPLNGLCPTQAAGLQSRIPLAVKRTAYQDSLEAAVVVWAPGRQRRVLLRQCQQEERWAGLWDFPRFLVDTDQEPAVQAQLADGALALTGMHITPLSRLARIKHGVTRYRITLLCYQALARTSRLSSRHGPLRWVACDQLPSVALNATGRRIGETLIARDKPAL
jgi:A/G-specific adenine glycosylase